MNRLLVAAKKFANDLQDTLKDMGDAPNEAIFNQAKAHALSQIRDIAGILYIKDLTYKNNKA